MKFGYRTLHRSLTPGDVQSYERFGFENYDGLAWECFTLHVSVSVTMSAAAPVALAVVSFEDQAAGPFARKRVLLNDGGELTSFVSDNLGRGWPVPRRVSSDGPMELVVELERPDGLGAGDILVEMWWEPRWPRGLFNRLMGWLKR